MGDNLSLGGSSGAGRSQKQHLWRASGCSVTEPDSEHAGQVIGNVLLLLVVAVVEVDELAESGVDLSLVDIPLAVEGFGDLLQFLAVELLVDFSAILTDASKTHTFGNAQVDEFVGDDTQLLEGKSLDFSSWEAFNNPADTCLLGLLNFSVNDLDNDFIIDILE